MTMWALNFIAKKPELKNPVLIEGLPGIGNVGKLALDFIISETGAKKIAEFHSHAFPHTVFVNEHNLVELPAIEVFVKQNKKGQDLLLLAGDVQPLDEQSCYQFSDKVLEMAKEFKCKEIITLGGIALKQVPKTPQVFLTGNNKEIIKKYKKSTALNNDLYGIVGPIVGVSGVLPAMAKRKNLDAVTLLAETYGHPMFLGVAGAREIIKVLNSKLSLKLNIKKLEKELTELEQEVAENPALGQALRFPKLKKPRDTSYIG